MPSAQTERANTCSAWTVQEELKIAFGNNDARPSTRTIGRSEHRNEKTTAYTNSRLFVVCVCDMCAREEHSSELILGSSGLVHKVITMSPKQPDNWI